MNETITILVIALVIIAYKYIKELFISYTRKVLINRYEKLLKQQNVYISHIHDEYHKLSRKYWSDQIEKAKHK